MTDEAGEVVYRFAYGAYGELTGITDRSGEELLDEGEKSVSAELSGLGIRFLYNGDMGVQTDANGLYYMRARYYNEDIKRFINRDVLTGSIQESQSLNRYSYVTGNPVRLADPFGLCGETRLRGYIHGLLDKAGWFNDGADVANAALYLAEGNTTMAAATAAALVGSKFVIGVGGKIKNGIKAGKASKKAAKAAEKAAQEAAEKEAREAAKKAAEEAAEKTLRESGEEAAQKSAQEGAQEATEKTAKKTGEQAAQKSTQQAGQGASKEGTKAAEQGVEDAAENSAKKPDDTVIYGGCFVAGTKVKVASGEKNIEDVKEGDEVYAHDTITGETGLKKVVEISVHVSTEIAYVEVGDETITATTNHPFYVVGFGYKAAEELNAGEEVLLLNGETKAIRSVTLEHLKEPVPVYNFEVEDWHTYYVSGQGVLVHNYNGPCSMGGSSNGGSGISLNDLPENVQQSYHKYDKAGWKGNVSGQTPGTAAGRKWENKMSQLPTVDANGNPITYREFDVNNFKGGSRDGERFVVGSDGSVWYTDSHYGQGTSLNGIDDFVKIK